MTLDDLVYSLLANQVNIDPLIDTSSATLTPFGARLRFYGKKWPVNTMCLGKGSSFQEAVHEAAIKLRDGRLEKLDWSARPWPTGAGDAAGSFLSEL